MKRAFWIVFVLLVVSILVGCGTGVVRREVEKSVAESLPQLIGPADSYKVSAYGSTIDMLRGNVERLEIAGVNVRPNRGPVLATLLVSVKGVSFDTGSKKIKRVAGTDYSASITQDSLSKYLADKYPDINALKVELGSGDIKLSARPGVSFVAATVQASAKVQVREERILALDVKTIKVAGVSAPGLAVDLIASRFGDIYDASDLGYDARIKTATITPGLLTLTGDLDLMKAQTSKRQASDSKP